MPRPYPKEFRDDVVAVDRQGQAPLTQIAKEFGISETCLSNWMQKANIEDGSRPGLTVKDAEQVREMKKRNRLLEQQDEVLRRAASYLSQANLPGKECSLSSVRCPAAGAPIRVSVAVACRVLGLSTQGYYKWLRSPVSQRVRDDAHLIDQLRDLHQDDPWLGYRFLADEVADAGVAASQNRVWRPLFDRGNLRLHARRKSKAGRPGPAVVDDLLAAAALRHAIALRSPDGTIVHSDRGSKFRSKKVVRLLKDNGL